MSKLPVEIGQPFNLKISKCQVSFKRNQAKSFFIISALTPVPYQLLCNSSTKLQGARQLNLYPMKFHWILQSLYFKLRTIHMLHSSHYLINGYLSLFLLFFLPKLFPILILLLPFHNASSLVTIILVLFRHNVVRVQRHPVSLPYTVIILQFIWFLYILRNPSRRRTCSPQEPLSIHR